MKDIIINYNNTKEKGLCSDEYYDRHKNCFVLETIETIKLKYPMITHVNRQDCNDPDCKSTWECKKFQLLGNSE